MSTIRTNAIVDASGGNTAQINGITPALASQAEAQAGTDNTKLMTPLRNLQAGLGAPHAVLEDQKASGTAGQTLTNAVWVTRNLNTEVRDPSGIVSIASNEFTVTVDCWCEFSTVVCSTTKSRLYNVTDAAIVAEGTYPGVFSGQSGNPNSAGGGLLTAGKTYRVESRCGTGGNTAAGTAASQGVEVYARVLLWRR